MIEELLASNATIVNSALEQRIESLQISNLGSSRLVNAMKYSLLGNAKRIRSFIAIESAKLFGTDDDIAIDVACAIECIHAYSLVHDDLPALDNSDTRRNKPSCHKQFDEETAILAGNSLMTLGFEILSSMHINPLIKASLILKLCANIGFNGMMAGQMMDIMLLKGVDSTPEDFIHMNKLKTGDLFAMSAEIGPILAITNDENHNTMKGFGYDFGCIFQITDDILDMEEDAKNSHKETYINKIGGIENAKNHILLMKDRAIFRVAKFGQSSQNLVDLVKYISQRVFVN